MRVTLNQNFTFNNHKSAAKNSAPSFKSHEFGRTYDNKDPNTQLYRGVGESEIRELFKGKTLEGTYYATSNPKGYRGKTWKQGGGYGDYFIAFNKKKIKFRDHRDFDADTRYLVEPYNIADVETIRKGTNNHGELLYSMDFEHGKALDIEQKTTEIKSVLQKLQSLALSDKEKAECIDILESYSKEFPNIRETIDLVNKPGGRFVFILKENFFKPKMTTEEELPIIKLIKSFTKEKVQEIDECRNLTEKFRLRYVDVHMFEEYEEYRELYTEPLNKSAAEVAERLRILTGKETLSKTEAFEKKLAVEFLNKLKTLKF